jgi:hypothetical protein
MGNFVARAGLAHELFRAAYAFIGHRARRPGACHGAACAGFGAICGSSIATAATMSQGGLPADEALGYSRLPVHRRDRRRRHAGHHDPAVDHHGHLRHRDRDQHRQAVRGRRHAGPAVRRAADGRRGLDHLARPAGRPGRRAQPPGPSASARCAASGAWRCWWWWCWAASTAACSPPPKARASAHRAPSSSRWRAGADLAVLFEVLVEAPAPPRCCSPS